MSFRFPAQPPPPLPLHGVLGSVFGGDPDEPVHLLLELLGDELRLARVSVLLLDRTSDRLSVEGEWCAPGVPPAVGFTEGVSRRPFVWLAAALSSGQTVCVPCVGELPGEAVAEGAFMGARQTDAFMALGLEVPGAGRGGILLLEGMTGARPWMREEEAAARRIGRLLERELRRLRSEAELLRSEERYHAVLDLAGIGAWEWLPGSSVMHVSDGLLALLGTPDIDNLLPVSRWLRAIAPGNRPTRRRPDPARKGGNSREWSRSLQLRRPQGTTIVVEETGRALGEQGAVLALVRPTSPRPDTD